MAHYLVTGGNGFIGSHLADALLLDGHRVRILDDLSTGKRENAPAQAELAVGDVANADAVAAAMRGVDGCFHLAAVAAVQRYAEDWAGAHRVNLDGAINVFGAARRSRAGRPLPVVYASSAAVYGDNPDVPLAETAVPAPISSYGADKLACELHGGVAAHIHGVPTAGLRLFNVYGPRQDPSSPYSGVISIFARRLSAGEPLEIFGDGEQMRDFVYVRDAVRAFVAAMAALVAPARPEAAVYNVCTGQGTRIKALAELLGSLLGVVPRLAFAPARAGDIRVSTGNGERAATALGVRPGTALRDGLRATLAAQSPRPA